MYKYLRLSLVIATSAWLCSGARAAPDTVKIRKCQDATGKWHYGNSAAEECSKSKVIEMSESGVNRKVIDAPPTESDIKQREQKELEKQKAAEQAKKDELLLSAYAHEADITYVRDRKIAQLESSVRASEDTLKSLRAALARIEGQATEEQKSGKGPTESTAKALEQTRSQIAKHEAAIATRRQEQEAVRVQSAAELARYRELKRPKITK